MAADLPKTVGEFVTDVDNRRQRSVDLPEQRGARHPTIAEFLAAGPRIEQVHDLIDRGITLTEVAMQVVRCVIELCEQRFESVRV